MSIGEAVANVINLDDLDILRRVTERLLDNRLLQLLEWKMEHGLEVGFLFDVKKKGRRGIARRVPCNGRITKMHKRQKRADVLVTMPVRYADKLLRIPIVWLVEPYQIHDDAGDEVPGLQFTADA